MYSGGRRGQSQSFLGHGGCVSVPSQIHLGLDAKINMVDFFSTET